MCPEDRSRPLLPLPLPGPAYRSQRHNVRGVRKEGMGGDHCCQCARPEAAGDVGDPMRCGDGRGGGHRSGRALDCEGLTEVYGIGRGGDGPK